MGISFEGSNRREHRRSLAVHSDLQTFESLRTSEEILGAMPLCSVHPIHFLADVGSTWANADRSVVGVLIYCTKIAQLQWLAISHRQSQTPPEIPQKERVFGSEIATRNRNR